MRLTPSEIKEIATAQNAERWHNSQDKYSFIKNVITQYFGDDAILNASDMEANTENLEDALDQTHMKNTWEAELYLSWLNDFISTERFAEHYNLKPARALEIIEKGRANHHRRTSRKQDASFSVRASHKEGENVLCIQPYDRDDQPLDVKTINYKSQTAPVLESFCTLENAMAEHGIEADIQGQDGTYYHGTIIH